MTVMGNATGAELKRLKRLKAAMGKWKMGLSKLGRELGLCKTAMYKLVTLSHYPIRCDRNEINSRIDQILRGWEKKKKKTWRETTLFQGVESMEHLTHEAKGNFGLNCDPFVNEIHGREDLYPLPESERAYKFLEHIALYQGFGALIGEVGSGKTLLLRRLVDEQGDGGKMRFVQAQITNKKGIRYYHVLDALFYDLTGRSYGGGGRSMEQKARLVRELLDQAIREDQRVCLIIDDAQQMPLDTLRSLKQLYDYVMGFRRQLGIILLGQLELINLMSDVRLRETTQRCAYFFMKGLVTPGAVEKYLEFKIKKAGGDAGKIFDRDVFKLIEKHCSFTFKYEGKDFRLIPQLRVQNLAARWMNRAVELGEGRVTREVCEV